MKNLQSPIGNKHPWTGFFILKLICLIALPFFSACEAPTPSITATYAVEAETTVTTQPFSSPTTQPSQTYTPITTPTITAGPSPTSTPLPDLEPQSWQRQPIMVEVARIDADPLIPFRFTPLFVLYGDGLMVKRDCQDDICRYLNSQLDQQALCRLVNTIDRTGFLSADPSAFDVPLGTGTGIRISVRVFALNSVEIPDLDRWVENPNWYADKMGCPACFPEPVIDPAFIDVYRLLISYEEQQMTSLVAERLAVWLTEPVFSGIAQPWPSDLIPLSQLIEKSSCPDRPNHFQAAILDGQTALTLSSHLSAQGDRAPIFSQEGITMQITSRWLLPYEMPQTCDRDAGLYPPPTEDIRLWHCSPEEGTIPTATPTITPTPTITRTPLR